MKPNPLYTSFSLLVIALCAGLLLPALFMDGMFMDGQIYATVSHNLALGKGSFWDPTFSSTYMISYHEQPPLLFGMESLLFRLFGDSMYIERCYCLLMALLTATGILRCWKLLWPEASPERALKFLPVLFWFIMPASFWAYTNHVEEGTMVVFTLLGTEFQLRGMLRGGKAGWFMLAGAALVGAGLCKGVQGMFPLVLAPLFAICTKEITLKRGVFYGLITFLSAVAILGLIWMNPAARVSFAKYFHDRIEATFALASTATTGNRLFILFELLLNLALPLLMVLLIIFRKPSFFSRRSWFFFLLGICGTLPLMITREQRGFYLVTALPFYAMALAIAAAPLVAKRFSGWKVPRLFPLVPIGLILLVLVATVFVAGKPKRDADMLNDVYAIGKATGHNAVISVSPEIYQTWGLQAYLARHFQVSLSNEPQQRFLLLDIHANPQTVPAGYVLVSKGTKKYLLYRRFDREE